MITAVAILVLLLVVGFLAFCVIVPITIWCAENIADFVWAKLDALKGRFKK